MASISRLLFLLTLISIPLICIATDCGFPCLPAPQTPNNYPSPPPPVNPYTPPYWNYPPSSGNFPYNQPAPPGSFVYSSPPPPNPIVPWYPWYYHPPPSGSAGLSPPVALIGSVILWFLMGVIGI